MCKKILLSFLVLGVFLLHQDFWNWENSRLLIGFLPVGLAYHAAYALLASSLMAILVKCAWPVELDRFEAEHDADDLLPKP